MKFTTRDLVLISLFTALMVVGAYLKIPFPVVPVTFQLFFCVYAGLLLGARNGVMSQIVYIIIGLIGVPVFTQGGGPQYIFTPFFGYILGFALCSLIIGLLIDKISNITFTKVLSASVLGYSIIYIIGNIYFYFIMNLYIKKPMSLSSVFEIMIPYMIKDFILLIIAAYTSTIIIPILRKNGLVSVKPKSI
jgi:biotin transport system substrate-specific component